MKAHYTPEDPGQMQASMQRDSSFRGVVYGVFQRTLHSPRSGGSVVALVAAHPQAGTTYLANFLSELLNSDEDASSTVLDCRTLAQMHEFDMHAENSAIASTRTTASNKYGNWRSSPEFRVNYLNDLRRRYNSVLVDCPSLKEGTDILALAPLVEGVMLVIEANKTTKSQIAFLERTIEGAGGKVLGHLLNKRTYPIPDWAYKTLESWGI